MSGGMRVAVPMRQNKQCPQKGIREYTLTLPQKWSSRLEMYCTMFMSTMCLVFSGRSRLWGRAASNLDTGTGMGLGRGQELSFQLVLYIARSNYLPTYTRGWASVMIMSTSGASICETRVFCLYSSASESLHTDRLWGHTVTSSLRGSPCHSLPPELFAPTIKIPTWEFEQDNQIPNTIEALSLSQSSARKQTIIPSSTSATPQSCRRR